MTSRRSPPEKKAAAKRAPNGKVAEGGSTEPSAMARFRQMAKKVVSADRDKVAEIERREKRAKD